MQEVSLLEMLKSGVHFGHQKRRWHPKMKPYIYTARNGVYVIDLEKTAEKLREACSFLEGIVSKGGTVLLVATKRQAQPFIKEMSEATGMPFVTERWVGGTLTNFESISKLVKRLKDLRSQREKGELQKYTKREQLKFDEEIEYLTTLVGGIEEMRKIPDAILIVDIKKEKTAVREARKKKVPIVAVVDTNCNPKMVDYPIPANDDATKSIKLITGVLTQAIVEAKEQKKRAAEKAEAEAQPEEGKKEN